MCSGQSCNPVSIDITNAKHYCTLEYVLAS